MSVLKQTVTYLKWTTVAILMAIIHFYFLLGPGLGKKSDFLNFFYFYGLLFLGLILGGMVAFLYILIDIFYLKKKLKNNPKKTSIRFLVITMITLVVAIGHYILEKVIDVI